MEFDLAEQQHYWDRVAEDKTFTHPLDIADLRLRLSPESAILDYGCGYGRTLSDLESAGFCNLNGIDFSTEMINRGRSHYPTLQLRTCDGKHFPFSSSSFDCVLLFAVLTCIPDNRAQERIISEIERVLSPGGLLYVSDYLISSDERNQQRYARDPRDPDDWNLPQDRNGASH